MIEILSQDTINKIAAGEVIDRPSSVVKELVENAIDANASAITIEIKEGGISFIRITDNGTGINGSEIKTAFLRHATSKIKRIEDLMCVSSLGFRGEALSSIAAISQVELITKQQNSITGYRYVMDGGIEQCFEEVGVPDGTTFIVRNLFYNTPVRRKFLKSAQTEAVYIGSLIEHLALSHPDVSFRFISNNQNKLHTAGNMNLKDIIYEIYGREITRNLLDINANTQDITINGYIGRPAICRGNRSYENYFINGRYIKNNMITKAIEEAYKGYIMPHNYPFTAIHFEMNPLIMDVNVHPAKMELRFTQSDYVYHFVFDTIRNLLKNAELAVETQLPLNKNILSETTNSNLSKSVYPTNSFESKQIKRPIDNVNRITNNTLEFNNVKNSNEQNSLNNIQGLEKHFNVNENKSKKEVQKKTRLPEPFEINRSNEMIQEDNKEYKTNQEKEKQLSLFENPLLKAQKESDYKIIGQLFETYWLIEYEDKFYMMDQHAAHEKVIYERYIRHLKEKTMDCQMITPPIIVELNMREEQALNDNMDIFQKIGFEVEAFGGKSYKITGIPADLPNIDLNQLFIDILDRIGKENPLALDVITQRMATMACKAAVKGNNRLSENEAKQLIIELMQAENPYNCPHGRPTLLVMSKYEVERKFKRLV